MSHSTSTPPAKKEIEYIEGKRMVLCKCALYYVFQHVKHFKLQFEVFEKDCKIKHFWQQ